MDDERLPITTDTNWWHATVSFPDAGITPDAARALSAALSDHRYHFLRCAPSGPRPTFSTSSPTTTSWPD
ncbi:hypothetical protein ACWGH8_06545 [Nonomuraea muscovyensis]